MSNEIYQFIVKEIHIFLRDNFRVIIENGPEGSKNTERERAQKHIAVVKVREGNYLL